MLIKNKSRGALTDFDVTDELIYQNRRQVLKKLGFLGSASLIPSVSNASLFNFFSQKDEKVFKRDSLTFGESRYRVDDMLTAEDKATSHNNFYEFGTDKSDPIERSQQFNVNPWQLEVNGLVEQSLKLDYNDLFKKYALEERIYRLRCVEAWSMVIPWVGFPLAALLKSAKPLSSAKFVRFKTLYDPKQMPGQNKNSFLGGGIDYPYEEGLTIAEAMHPLTMLAVGMYGKSLPPQNGAPIRLVVPWKYGFKSIKSIVSIEFTEKQPVTTWSKLAPSEYGFYANVNPNVDHPRWSQASERRITKGGLLSQSRQATLMFNGYADEVAHLYQGLDLAKHY